jgi:hypothetical protein
VKYVQLTQQIARASVVQAEAANKPILTLRRDDTPIPQADTDAVIARIQEQLQTGFGTYIGPVLEVTNIGNGPALHVKWTINRFTRTSGFIPYICPAQWVSLQMATKVKMPAIPASYEVEFQYESISGTRYVSRTAIEHNTKVVRFEATTVAVV